MDTRTLRRRADAAGGEARYPQGLLAIALIALSYLLGSVPFGLLLARRFAGVDVRGAGSGNIGATNVARTAGKTLGLLTLALDAGKGALAVGIAGAAGADAELLAAVAVAAVLGHVFPVWLRFKGGKGVATVAGAFAALSPRATLAALGVFALVYALTRIVSVGSLAGAITLVAALFWIDGRLPVAIAGALTGVLVVARHSSNLSRLWRGSEKPL